jgi:transcriptional antiterminator RfaH
MSTKQSEGLVIQLDETEPRWFAVHTRSKCEKMVWHSLQRKQIMAYVPLARTTKRYQRKIKHYDKPLISCYVFVKIVKKEYVPVLETENVAGFVKFAKNMLAIPEEEINILRRVVLEDGLEVEAIPSGQIQTGDTVTINAGPLIGIQGIIIRADGKRKMQVELQKLGYTLLMSIDAAFLEKTGLDAG